MGPQNENQTKRKMITAHIF